MQFIDELTIEVEAGRGGDGSTAMRREKYRPLGGPAGGDGGKGGDVILDVDPRITTLMDLKYRRRIKADHGEHGRGKDQYGAGGADERVRVPQGTQVFDGESGALLADLQQPGQHFVAAAGGQGGRGNMHFVTATDRAPMRAEAGKPGARRLLRLELKLLADVGLVGFPNAGKSTLISTVSKARPKVADYPFTTLVPNLGVVSRGDLRHFVMADIPGIIEGAADGAGLGHRFLKHIERTRVLLFLVTHDPAPHRSLLEDLRTLRRELQRFDPALAQRPVLLSVSKFDLPEVRAAFETLVAELQSAEPDTSLLPFSAVTGEGVQDLLDAIERTLAAHPLPAQPRTSPLPAQRYSPPHREPQPSDEG